MARMHKNGFSVCLWLKHIVRYRDILIFSTFTLFEAFHCESYYQTEDSLAAAIISCREDINCSMVSTTACYNETDQYHLCGHTPDLMPDIQACTYRKKGSINFGICILT